MSKLIGLKSINKSSLKKKGKKSAGYIKDESGLTLKEKILETFNYKEDFERAAELKSLIGGRTVETKPEILSLGSCEEKCVSGCDCCRRKVFKRFVGWWLLTTIDDFENATLIEFFIDEHHCEGSNRFKANWYHGLQNQIREPNANDRLNEQVPTTVPNRLTCDVEVLGHNAVRFLNEIPFLSVDNHRSTFTIQSYNNDLAYVVLWTHWDGVADDVKYGYVETMMQYRRLPEKPHIQLERLPTDTNWNLPVNLFAYLKDYYLLMGQPEKADELNAHNWVGIQKYEELYQTFLHEGVTREVKSSISYRGDRKPGHEVGGEYTGIWKTKFPGEIDVTTIHTQGPHRITPFSTVHIDGLKGAFAVLNGTHQTAAFPRFDWSDVNPYPWVREDSVGYYLFIKYDSSGIAEDYNVNLHGRATITAKHGPVLPNIEYREFMAVLADFIVSTFGHSTHMRLRAWVYSADPATVPETFSQLREGLAVGSVRLSTFSSRNSTTKSQQLYWGPAVVTRSFNAPTFNINDPFGLGQAQFDPKFAYDIDYENYLDPDRTYNMFGRVVGPIDPENPITGQLVDIGYPTNGSRVEWLANKWGVFPGPDYFMYNAANVPFDANPVLYRRAQRAFLGGIIRPEFSNGKVVAYIRIASEDSPDGPLYELQTRSLVFGNPNLSTKAGAIWTDAYASLLRVLKAQGVTRYILDIRNNSGGYAVATSGIAALFGTDRPALTAKLAYAGDGNAPLIDINPATTQTFYNAAAGQNPLLNANEVAALYPESAIRSDSGRIDLIILDSTGAGSAGDVFPHEFIGPDPKSTVHNIGGNVFMRIVGDIDGVLYSGVKLYDAPPINNLNPQFVAADGVAQTPFYISTEAGVLAFDRHGSLVNPQPWTRPNVLLGMWFDQTEWVDIGLTYPVEGYPLGNIKPDPVFENQATWRDNPLEHAIVD